MVPADGRMYLLARHRRSSCMPAPFGDAGRVSSPTCGLSKGCVATCRNTDEEGQLRQNRCPCCEPEPGPRLGTAEIVGTGALPPIIASMCDSLQDLQATILRPHGE